MGKFTQNSTGQMQLSSSGEELYGGYLEGMGLHVSMSIISELTDDTQHAGFSSYEFLSLSLFCAPEVMPQVLEVWSLASPAAIIQECEKPGFSPFHCIW